MRFCRKFFSIFTIYFIRNLPILYNSNRYYRISVIFCSVFKNFLKGQFWDFTQLISSIYHYSTKY